MLTTESRERDFPSLCGRVYLNSAAEGIPPLSVSAALQQYFMDKQEGMDGRPAHFAQLDRVKELTAEFYGLNDAEIGICSCSSEAYNLVSMALALSTGDEVVINDLDFPAGVTPWLQSACPATVRVWRSVNGALRTKDLIPLLSLKTRFVTTSLVSFFNGFVVPLNEVCEVVRRRSSALLGVDITQALGRIPLDLHDVDLIVSSTHKWILSSHGGGLVGVPSARAAELTVPAGGWLHLQDAFGAQRFESAVSRPGAASYAVGMPNFPAIYAIRAGLEYIQKTGVAAIHAAAGPLTEQCIDGLAGMPVELLTPRNEPLAGIVAFRHPRADEIHQKLRERNIHIMGNAGRLRVAVHGYNTSQDIETLLSTLSEILKST